ncbi:MAG: lysophospholipid acyltransferase family protein [Phycisphaerae bacterium]|nr:lysophospholipid acyltransferase family protein [Phycisphaerae bacterium]
MANSAALRQLLIHAFLWLNNVHRRLLTVFFGIVGPRAAYQLSGFLARLLYRLMTPVRDRSEAQCRAALGKRIAPEEISQVAKQSFVHRVWNLTDLMLAERFLHRTTYQRYTEGVPEPHLSNLLENQRRGQPAILLTAYYGSFDLLPLILGFQGVRAGAVYRTHLNPGFDAYRRRIRARSGCELIPIEQALERLPQLLESGGNIALVADHHAERRGLPVTFLGLPTMAVRSVGLLAWRFDAEVAVAGMRRIDNSFRFEIEVTDTIKPPDWAHKKDPVRYITERYLRALEKIVLRDPAQYVWGYARWGKDLARRLTEADEPVQAVS